MSGGDPGLFVAIRLGGFDTTLHIYEGFTLKDREAGKTRCSTKTLTRANNYERVEAEMKRKVKETGRCCR